MGIGAALVMPATLSIITTIFPPEERNRAIGVWAGFAGAGGAIGPIVSGALLERYWWGSAVLVNLPLVAATFIAIWTFAPESRDESETPLDPVGAVLSLAGLGALVFTIIQGGENGWTTTPVIAAAIVAVVALTRLPPLGAPDRAPDAPARACFAIDASASAAPSSPSRSS